MDRMEIFNTDSLKSRGAHTAIKWICDTERDWKLAFQNMGLQRPISYPRNPCLQYLEKLQVCKWGYMDLIQVSAMDVSMINNTT